MGFDAEPTDGASTGDLENQEPTEVTSNSGDNQQSAEETFFDASKVPAALQPSFREMQAAWTKKTEEYKPYKDFERDFGSLQEVRDHLESLRTEQGVIQLWSQISAQLGITPQQLAKLFDEETVSTQSGTQAPTQPDTNRPITVEEFQQWQQEQASAQAMQKAEGEVKTALDSLGNLSDRAKTMVLAAAIRQPDHLSITEQVKRAYAEYQAELEAYAATKTPAKPAPQALSGGSPTGQRDVPKDFKQAREQAMAFVRQLSSSGPSL